ncbi:MAG TPA: GH25 family lysozyme [Sandaracinaceae bacterium LLY-WYZ-13_1]|nr:GH25 family lysozyme [Sandaracinaceae bacterium LLY-WYZ-13_1]
MSRSSSPTTLALLSLLLGCSGASPGDGLPEDGGGPPVARDDGGNGADAGVPGDAGSDAAVQSPDAGFEPSTDAGPPPVEPRIVDAVDVSHWTRTLTDADVDCLWEGGYRHVIVGTQLDEVTRQQLEIAIRGGLTVDLYVYLYWGESITAQVHEALAIADDFPEVGRVWLDVEEDPMGREAATLEMLVEEGLTALDGFPGGIYTGAGFWRSYMADSSRFSDVPLWYARYDGLATLDTWDDPDDPDRFGGWADPTGKQYADHHVHTCGLPMDRNVMWSSAVPAVEVDRSSPADDGDPPPAPTALRPDGSTVTTTYVRPTAPVIREATAYTFEMQVEGASGWDPYVTWELEVPATEIYPVVDDTRYRFRFQARNAHGAGPWSDWAVFDFRPGS